MEERRSCQQVDQAFACVRVCQMLSNYYRDLILFRYDALTEEVYILTADNIQVVIPPTGNWRFINET